MPTLSAESPKPRFGGSRFDELLSELAWEHGQEVARLRSLIEELKDNVDTMLQAETTLASTTDVELAVDTAQDANSGHCSNQTTLTQGASQPHSSLSTASHTSNSRDAQSFVRNRSIAGMSIIHFQLHSSWTDPPSQGLWGHELDWQMIKKVNESDKENSQTDEKDALEHDENALFHSGVSPHCVFHPAHRLRLAWDCVGALFVVYDMFAIPMIMCFDVGENWFSTVTGWTISFFWTFDMILSALFTGYYKNGDLVMNRRTIFINYLKGWFWLDLCVVVPDWVMKVMGMMNNVAGLGRVLRAARVMRLLRMLRAAKMQKIFNYVYDTIDSEYTFVVFGLLKMVFCIFALNHVIACLWYGVGRISYSQAGMNWLQDSGIRPVYDSNFAWKYTTSLHWSITQFTPASMDVSATNVGERVFSIVILFCAMVSVSSLIGSVNASITALRAMSSDNMKQTWLLRRYFKRKHISPMLQDRVFKYLDHQQHLKVQQKSVKPENVKLLTQIPSMLEKQLSNEMNAPVLCQHPFFAYVSNQISTIMFKICHSGLEELRFAAQDVVFYCDEDASYMYFVKTGRFEFHLLDGHCLDNRLGPKTWASEAVLWTGWRHRGSLLANEPSDALAVNPQKFRDVCRMHPRPWYFAQQYARKFVKCLNTKQRYHIDLVDVACKFNQELQPVKQYDTLGQELSSHGGLEGPEVTEDEDATDPKEVGCNGNGLWPMRLPFQQEKENGVSEPLHESPEAVVPVAPVRSV